MPKEEQLRLPRRIRPILANRRVWPIDLGIKRLKEGTENVAYKFVQMYKDKAWGVHLKEVGYAKPSEIIPAPMNREQSRRYRKYNGGFKRRKRIMTYEKMGTNHERHLENQKARSK